MCTKATHCLCSLRRGLLCIKTTFIGVLFLIALAENADAQWVEQGPGPNTQGQVEGIPQRPVVGAIKTVVTHPTDAATIYVGAVNGGIWKTTNATAATPTWVEQLGVNRALSIGAIAFDPTDGTNQTLIAGVGRFSSFASRGSDRVGVWRTIDGGTTWTLVSGAGGTVAGLNITGVAPRGTTLVVSANAADSFVNRGVWRSTNTGGSWTQISGTAATGLPAGPSFDLAGDPSNNSRLFTNSGNSGIYRSVDAGATWTKVSNAAMDAVLAAGTSNVKISVGTSNNVYVAIVGGGQLTGLFRSGDGGTTWTALDLPATIEGGVPVGIHPGGQGGIHLSIAADLTNANVVYIAGDRQATPFPNSIGATDFSGRVFRVDASRPAGTQSAHITHSNTSGATSPHADSRDMAIDIAGNLIETNDGGIYKRSTPRLNTGNWSSLIGNLRTTEFHAAGWDSNSRIAMGGAQDTGSPHQTTTGSFLWLSVSTADGGDVAVNDTGTPGISVRFSSNQFLGGFRRRTYDSSNTFLTQVFLPLTLVGPSAPLLRQFYTPIEINNVAPTRLVIGGANSVYESMDQGDTISEIGPGIVANGTGPHSIAYGATGNANMLYAGSGDRVFVRTAAPPAALTQSATYPGTGTGRPVMGVTINHSTPQNAFVIDPTNVYRTGDAGAAWTNVTGNLLTLTPGVLRSVAFSTNNPTGAVIVGSDNGVFTARGPFFTTWAVLGTGLPRAPVYDLEYDPVSKLVIAGLMGRGAWTISPIPAGAPVKWAFSLHTGLAIPVKGFGSGAGPGLLTEIDLEYRITPKLSLEGVLGRYDFGLPAEIYSGSLLVKGYFPAGTGRFYVSGGPGAYHITGGNTHFGLTGGAGFNQPINTWLEVESGVSYAHIFRSSASDLGFIGIRGGVKIKF